MADGLFLSTARQVAKDYPDIIFDAELLDNTCLRVLPQENIILIQIVTDPTPYNDRVMVMPNLYGDILSDLSAG
jgi:isocitrate dehydrogenase (NAD+)